MLVSLPALAHRVTVLGSTLKSAATSDGVSKVSCSLIVAPIGDLAKCPFRTDMGAVFPLPDRNDKGLGQISFLGLSCLLLRRHLAPARDEAFISQTGRCAIAARKTAEGELDIFY